MCLGSPHSCRSCDSGISQCAVCSLLQGVFSCIDHKHSSKIGALNLYLNAIMFLFVLSKISFLFVLDISVNIRQQIDLFGVLSV